MKILVTGAAGFIGFYLVEKLASLGHSVIGIDNINDYYDVNLKYARLSRSGILKDEIQYGKPVKSSALPGYAFVKLDLTDAGALASLFAREKFDCVCSMAAQAGVRYSLEKPQNYIDSNVTGFLNVLESCRAHNVNNLVYASSSSVYGENEKTPFSVTDSADRPISLYAATKRANELMAYAYSRLFNIRSTGLRFFTVYGPWGRPDMAYYKFALSIINGRPIEIYNNGGMSRDFTYIDDVVEGVAAAVDNAPKKDYVIYNLGNSKPESLTDFIEILENSLCRKAEKIYLGMQAGDVPVTMADIEFTKEELGWRPKTSVADGLKLFARWFTEYYNVK